MGHTCLGREDEAQAEVRRYQGYDGKARSLRPQLQPNGEELTRSFKQPLISRNNFIPIVVLKVQQCLQMERGVGQNHLQWGDVLTGEEGGSWGISAVTQESHGSLEVRTTASIFPCGPK